MFNFLRSRNLRNSVIVTRWKPRLEALGDRTLPSTGCVPAPSGLVAWWPGDGGGQDIVGGHDVTPLNGASFAPAEVAAGFHLDGVDDYATGGNVTELNFGTGDFSIEVWAQFDRLGVTEYIVNKQVGAPTYQGWDLRKLSDDRIQFIHSQDSTTGQFHSVNTLASITDTNFHHIAAVLQGSSVRIWIDGVEQATETTEGAPGVYDVSNTGPLTIGKAAHADGGYLAGRVDELSLYGRPSRGRRSRPSTRRARRASARPTTTTLLAPRPTQTPRPTAWRKGPRTARRSASPPWRAIRTAKRSPTVSQTTPAAASRSIPTVVS